MEPSYVAILIRSPSVFALMFNNGVSFMLPGTLLQVRVCFIV
jgi:hypothetical protein